MGRDLLRHSLKILAITDIHGSEQAMAGVRKLTFHPDRCIGCGMCVENCAYGAIDLVEDKRFGTVASINEALCKGCGACSGNCRCSAIDIFGFSAEQIYSILTKRSY